MKKLLYIPFLMLLCSTNMLGQAVSINTDGSAADGSAILDVKSADKGFLPPRIALTGATDAVTIASPATGLLIYNTATAGINDTAVKPGYFYWNGTRWTPFVTGAHYIGESYGGGIVFFVYDNGQHGLIAATADQSTDVRWYGGSFTNTEAKADGVGGGKANTAIIIANQGPVDGNTFAARVCNEYSVMENGVTYGDWYLPSKHELNLLYLQKNVVGGFASDFYWSSTEGDTSIAWSQNFNSGNQGNSSKVNLFRVRAVRAF